MNDYHYLIEHREPPASLVALRSELAYHQDIIDYAIQGGDFGDCIGRIALKLDIAMDGMYEVEPMCELLVSALRARRFNTPAGPLLPGLFAAEMIEDADSIRLQEVGEVLEVPKDAVVVQTETSVPRPPKLIVPEKVN